ncbi:RagB/SusD family nutrient uptake outer membrane protein [Flavobacterium ranwuense]|uniref:RagB/SusD family nutrient uptake outer membrane protein n=1 Tax=Flavobacterium ranwuense TaxID=2541725 RepID=A0ABY2DX45_9FLAO|nr:RagB/SusD family nutrient uptake outer membrane protein [Flavobacterium ranwuense]TDE29807.1 RagB/SusD family nutrient uptake outer membrane protein [Flavobacterium ranwuense]
MKKINFILLALIVSFFSSCEDAIDIIQPGELGPDVTFQTVDDLQLGLNGVYAAVAGENAIAFSTVFTDEVAIGFANGGQGLNGGEYVFNLTAASADPAAIWYSNYALINRANRVIAGAALVTPTAANEAAYKNILAQAHILRAWGHFVLLSHFTTNMADDSALGVIKLDFVPLVTDQLPRNTNGEVFALINEDLNFVSSLSTNAANTSRTFVSTDFVKAFRARMAAYRGKYAEVTALADQLIAAYPLTPRSATVATEATSLYLNIWTDVAIPTATQNEVIFKLERVPGNRLINATWASVNSTVNGSPFYEMSTRLYNLLNNPNDIRRRAFLSPSSDPAGNRIVIGKYPGSGGIVQLNDIKIFRTPEMYFLKAEALADAGNFTGVAAQLQAVTNARFVAGTAPVIATPTTAQAAFAEILKQRRIELCFEGHRYLDLKRLGVRAGVSIDRDPADCSIYNACTIPNTDYRFTMPIPVGELSANTGIKDQQNPGYTN